MDKKNTIIGVLLIIAAFYFMYDSTTKDAAVARARQAEAAKVAAMPESQKSAEQVRSAFPLKSTDANVKEQFCDLGNENISVKFTNKGGAIADVKVLKYADRQGSDAPFSFNDVSGAYPALSLAFFDPSGELPQPFLKPFRLEAKSGDTVSYEYVDAGKMRISRTYVLVKADKLEFTKYTIFAKTKIENLSDKPLSLREVYMCLGAVPPTESDVYGSNLAFLLYNGSAHFARSSSFIDSSGFLGIGATQARIFEKISAPDSTWGSVKNQFFAAVFTPEGKTSNAGFAIPLKTGFKTDNKYMKNSVAGFMGFAAESIAAGQSWEISGTYYVGPKELDTLASLGAGQEEVMNYGWFGFVSRPLSRLLVWINSWVETVSPDWSWLVDNHSHAHRPPDSVAAYVGSNQVGAADGEDTGARQGNPRKIQGRPQARSAGDDENLLRIRNQPARRLSADFHPNPDFHRSVLYAPDLVRNPLRPFYVG